MENSVHPTILNGKICYLEIPAKDIAVSSSFFRKVFGWKIRTRSDGQTAFDDTTGEVSGSWITNRSTSTFAGLLIYIMVDNISETLTLVVDHGGSIVQPVGMDAPELTARFSDPAGNLFGLYQEPDPKG
jgi:predicted enzyme related to lactoylglutathione lyase